MKKIIVMIFFGILIWGCTGNKNKKITLVESFQLKTEDKSFSPKEIFDKIKYIDIKENKDNLFRSIDKIIVDKRYIYILDAIGANKVFKYDLEGNFISNIGNKGKGPGEYIKLHNFDLKGNLVYLNDVSGHNILIYNTDNEFIKSCKLPFPIYNLKKLDNGYLLYLIKDKSLNKVVLTDNKFKILKTFLKYGKDENGEKLFWPNTFRDISNGKILCTLPYDDNLYFFSDNGEKMLKKTFDFGKYSIPNKIRDNVDEIDKELKNKPLSYFSDAPVIVNNYLISNIEYYKNGATLFYNMKESNYKIYKMELNKLDIKNICCLLSANSDFVISWFNYAIYSNCIDKPQLSVKMFNDLKKGNRIICFHELKKY